MSLVLVWFCRPVAKGNIASESRRGVNGVNAPYPGPSMTGGTR